MNAFLRGLRWTIGAALLAVAAAIVLAASEPWWFAVSVAACTVSGCTVLAYAESASNARRKRRQELDDERRRRAGFIEELAQVLDAMPPEERTRALFRLYCQCKDDPAMNAVMQLIEDYRSARRPVAAATQESAP